MNNIELNITNNSKIYKQLRRKLVSKKFGKCSYCRPHKGDNLTLRKHGVKKPKYKTITKG